MAPYNNKRDVQVATYRDASLGPTGPGRRRAAGADYPDSQTPRSKRYPEPCYVYKVYIELPSLPSLPSITAKYPCIGCTTVHSTKDLPVPTYRESHAGQVQETCSSIINCALQEDAQSAGRTWHHPYWHGPHTSLAASLAWDWTG